MTTATTDDPDRVTRTMLMRAPLARVWAALTDHVEFGTWFRVALDGPFRVGAISRGHITYPGHEHLRFEAEVVAIEAPSRFALRWHPFPIDPGADYSAEPTTLVEFTLVEEAGGTRVTVTESGFAQIPAHRRGPAFAANSQGWTIQLDNLAAHVAG